MPIQVNQRKFSSLSIKTSSVSVVVAVFVAAEADWVSPVLSVRLVVCFVIFLGGVFLAAVLAFFCGGLITSIGLSSSSSLSTTGAGKLAPSLISILAAACSK